MKLEVKCFEEWFVIDSLRENSLSKKNKLSLKLSAIEFSSVKQTGAGKVKVQGGDVFVS